MVRRRTNLNDVSRTIDQEARAQLSVVIPALHLDGASDRRDVIVATANGDERATGRILNDEPVAIDFGYAATHGYDAPR